MNTKSKILLIGKSGQAGWELQTSLSLLGEVIALDYPEIDLAMMDTVRNCIRQVKPRIIVNAAAYTNVDRAESEPQLAFAINGTAPGVIAKEANTLGAVLVHYSTDYVFDGLKSGLYTEKDIPNPINTYGKSKLSGEQAIQNIGGAYLILRTSWLYSLRRDNFVTRVLKWVHEKPTLTIVDDQAGSPTWARVLAQATAMALHAGKNDLTDFITERRGVYHLASTGSPTRFDFARKILEFDPHRQNQVVMQLMSAKSSSFPTPAERPGNSALDSTLFQTVFGLRVPDWEEMLKLALGEK